MLHDPLVQAIGASLPKAVQRAPTASVGRQATWVLTHQGQLRGEVGPTSQAICPKALAPFQRPFHLETHSLTHSSSHGASVGAANLLGGIRPKNGNPEKGSHVGFPVHPESFHARSRLAQAGTLIYSPDSSMCQGLPESAQVAKLRLGSK